MITFTNKNNLMHFLENVECDVILKKREVFSKECMIAELIIDPAEKLFSVMNKILNVGKEDIVGGSRKRHLVDARTIFAHELRDEYPMNELARIMKRNHSTAAYYLARYGSMLKYADFRELVEKVEKNL